MKGGRLALHLSTDGGFVLEANGNRWVFKTIQEALRMAERFRDRPGDEIDVFDETGRQFMVLTL